MATQYHLYDYAGTSTCHSTFQATMKSSANPADACLNMPAWCLHSHLLNIKCEVHAIHSVYPATPNSLNNEVMNYSMLLGTQIPHAFTHLSSNINIWSGDCKFHPIPKLKSCPFYNNLGASSKPPPCIFTSHHHYNIICHLDIELASFWLLSLPSEVFSEGLWMQHITLLWLPTPTLGFCLKLTLHLLYFLHLNLEAVSADFQWDLLDHQNTMQTIIKCSEMKTFANLVLNLSMIYMTNPWIFLMRKSISVMGQSAPSRTVVNSDYEALEDGHGGRKQVPRSSTEFYKIWDVFTQFYWKYIYWSGHWSLHIINN